MRKMLFAAAALAGLSALAACGDRGSSVSSDAPAAAAPAPASTPTPEPKPTTEAAAVSGEGAYGMPRGPVPYDQLTAYEQQQARSDGRALPLYEDHEAGKRRNPDAVFY
jgi:hypothetical protein